MLPIFLGFADRRDASYLGGMSTEKHISDWLGSIASFSVLQIGAMLPIWGVCQRKNIFPTGLGASPCTKPIWDSFESSSQAEPFITNRPCSPSTPNVHCHRVHSISYFRQQMQRCISFPIPGNRCRTSGLYNCAVSPALDRKSSTHSFIFFFRMSILFLG